MTNQNASGIETDPIADDRRMAVAMDQHQQMRFEQTAAEIRDDSLRLAERLGRVAENANAAREGTAYSINSLGEVQAHGQEIDRLCIILREQGEALSLTRNTRRRSGLALARDRGQVWFEITTTEALHPDRETHTKIGLDDLGWWLRIARQTDLRIKAATRITIGGGFDCLPAMERCLEGIDLKDDEGTLSDALFGRLLDTPS